MEKKKKKKKKKTLIGLRPRKKNCPCVYQRQPSPAAGILPPVAWVRDWDAGRVDQGLGDGRDPAKADGGRPSDERGE
jgi:hypothetical protein